MKKSKIIALVIYFIAFVLPILGLINCPEWNDAGMAVESCILDGNIFREYAFFYYALFFFSVYSLLIPIVIYVGVVIVFTELIKKIIERIENNTTKSDAKSFKLYTEKAPLLLKIVGGLMWLGGIGMILEGIPLLIGFGIIPITLGIFNIKYAKIIFKMQRKGFKGALILQGVVMVISIILWGISGFPNFNAGALTGISYALVVIGVLYLYRDKFINE